MTTSASYGPFRVLRPLGRGGMGSVFLARHTTFDTPVAVKVLDDDSHQARAAFMEEVQACCRLDHPHIARVYDVGIDPRPWFAMELASGSLRQEVERHRSWRGLSTLVLQLLDALGHAHGHGVVHRDLKPANVLFARDDDRRPGLKLVDFGVAACSPSSLQRAGTPVAMAPEQWKGLTDLGPWTDIYALGVLVWSLCCGRPPIDTSDHHELYHRQQDGDFDPFRPRLEVPRDLELWLRTCLAVEPGARFACTADARLALPDSAHTQQATAGWTGMPEDAPTVVSAGASPSWSTVPSGPEQAEMTERLVRPTSCPVPLTAHDLEAPSPGAPVAGAGLGVLPWRRPRLRGRDREQVQLWRLLRHVEASRTPRRVALAGLEGVGRTALGQWLVQKVRATSGALAVRVTSGRGLQGVVDALLQPLGRPGDPLGRRRGLHRIGALTDASLAALEALERVYEGPRAAGMVLDVLQAICQHRTVVVVVDADHGGAGLADLAARWHRVAGPGLLVHQGLDAEADLSLEVPPLRPAAIGAMLDGLLPLHPSLLRELSEQSAGRPAHTMELLEDVLPSVVLGPHGFERVATDLPEEPVPVPVETAALDPLECLAHLDAEASVDLWAEACGRPRDDLIVLAHRLQQRRGCEVAHGVVRLTPRMRDTLRARARSVGRAGNHHRAIAQVLERHNALPHRLGQAWIDAGQVERGVAVWLDQWRRLLALQGHRAVEGLFRDAERLLARHEPVEALHGRLSTLLPVVADRGYAVSDPAEALERRDTAWAKGWADTACEAAYYATLCTPTGPARRRVLQEGLDLVDARCADGPWARFRLTGALASQRWGFDPEGPMVVAARRAIAEAERTRDCGQAALVHPALLDRLGPSLDAALATHRGDHEAAVIGRAKAAQISRTHDAVTLIADLHDLAAAHVAAGQRSEAKGVYEEIERLARWVGAISSESAVRAQRAGLAVLDRQWDRAARLAHQAQVGLPPGYPTAMMRLIRAMNMLGDGQLDAAIAVVDDTLDDLVAIRPADEELRVCLTTLIEAMEARGTPPPAHWGELVRLAT